MRAKARHAVLALLAIATAGLMAASMQSCGDDGERPVTSGAGLIDWPMFGRVPQRTHYLPAEHHSIDPPLREAWSINTHALIEFPPAVANGVAYVVNKYGNARAVRLRDRHTLWRRMTDPSQSGAPTEVTAPLFHRGLLFLAYLDGELVALDAETGKPRWRRDLKAHLESSPLAVGGSLYIGNDRTDLVSLRASDGKLLWRFNAPGAIKASPSHDSGRVYVGDYESGMYCLDASSGKLIWRTNTTKARPFGEGGFYSSPAIAFGHVYAARDDGMVLAFDQATGKVDWHFKTGSYVYGSPAAAEVPGTPPSVYIGSYDEHLYALDARSGKQRWKFDVGGAVPGTSTVIGRTVYVSSFKTRRTSGVDARTGRPSFTLDQAGYTPMVSDGRRLYLIGYYELVGLAPRR